MRWLGRNLPYLGGLLLLIGVGAIIVVVLGGNADGPLLPLGIVAGTFGVLAVVFGLLMPVFTRAAIPDGEVLAAAVSAGRLAAARILSATATGVRVNMRNEYLVDLVVAATDRPPYRADVYLRAPRHWTSDTGIITVVRVDADSPRVVMVKDQAETDQAQKVPLDADAWRY